jgi:hypothetical protein
MKTYDEILKYHIEYEGYRDFFHLVNSSSTGSESIKAIVRKAAEEYAAQFKQSIREPTEEEIDRAWDHWYKDNGRSNTGSAWDSAIEWYKSHLTPHP